MNIVLLGANGRTGNEILKRAIAAGDHVTALVRNSDTLKEFAGPQLEIYQGDVCDRDTIASILSDQDVVMSTLGPRGISDAACSIYSRAAEAIVPAMEQSNVKRLVVTSTALLFPPQYLVGRLLRLIARNNHRHAGLMEQKISSSELNWTFARVGFLNSKSTTQYHCEVDAFSGGSISRAAVANYMYNEAKNRNHDCKIVGLSSGSH